MPRKPIVPVFAGAGSAPTIQLFAGNSKPQEKLPLAPSRLSIGMEWHLVVAGVLLALILTTYGNSFQSEWVLDNKYIIELDPRTKATSWDDVGVKPGVHNIFTQDYWWPKGISGLYRPMTSFTYWLNWIVFKNGSNPTPREQVVGFHWVNLAIHYLNAFLFYRLMLRLTRRFWVSFFAAAVFVTHPIATESVTNIIGRADMFAATTVVGCMLLWIDVNRHRENSTSVAAEESAAKEFAARESAAVASAASPSPGNAPTISESTDQSHGVLGYADAATRSKMTISTSELLLRIGWLTALMLLAIFGMLCKESWIAVGAVIVMYDLIYRIENRWRKFWLREGVVTLTRWILMLPLFYFAFNVYLLCIVPWLETLQTGSGGYVMTIIGTMFGLFVMLFSMVLLTTRKLLVYIVPLFAAMLLLCGLGIGHAANGPVIGLAVSAIVFIGVEIAVAVMWPENRETDPEKPGLWRGFFDGYFVLLPVVVLMWCTRHWVFGNTTPAEEPFLDNPLRGLGFIGSRMTAAKVWAMLLWKLIWPVHLSSDYSYNQVPLFGYHAVTLGQNLQCVFALLLFIAIGALALWCWRKGQKGIAFFIFLYYVNYFPTSNFPYIIGSIMAERFMYLPLIGFSAIVVIGADLVARRFFGGLDEGMRPGAQGLGLVARFPYLRYAPHAAMALLVMVYGVRSFYRNYAWHTDVTLWEAAKAESPLSFRSYQSYAFALFEQDAAGNCDKMIQTDEDGLKIVDDLPNPLNSSRLYLHLGMYYDLKGQLLSKQVPGGVEVTPAAIPWFQKSAEILERGVPIDRAFNEVNRDRDVKRGRDGNETPDVGLAPVYSYLGISYMRLGLLDQAERTFKYMRHLEPREQSGDVYLKLAMVQDRRGKYDDEAVSLMQAILLDSTRQEAWQALNEVFKRINTEPYPCILVNAEGRAQLDLSRAAVRTTVLQAYRDFVRIFLQAKQPRYAESARDVAVKTYNFDRATLFDPLFDPKYLANFPKPAPADPVFYKPPPVKFDRMLPEVRKAFLTETHGTTPQMLNEEIVDGRAVYTFDLDENRKKRHIRVSEEGVVLGDYGLAPRDSAK